MTTLKGLVYPLGFRDFIWGRMVVAIPRPRNRASSSVLQNALRVEGTAWFIILSHLRNCIAVSLEGRPVRTGH